MTMAHKIALGLLSVMLVTSLNTCTLLQERKQDWVCNYILGYRGKNPDITPELAIKLSALIVKYSEKYNLPYKTVSRLCGRESEFKRYAFNPNTEARGYGQILDRYWRYALYYIDDGKLGRYLKKHNYTSIERLKRYYYRDGYGMEIMCFAINACRKHKGGDLEAGIYMYGGGHSKGACQDHMAEYIDFIFE